MEATFVRELTEWTSDARLYKLSSHYPLYNWDGESKGSCDHIIVSAVFADYSGPETYIFPAKADGTELDMTELPGSFRGSIDHELALQNFLALAETRQSAISQAVIDLP